MLAYLFLIVAVGFRFLPHAWSFTPVGAALLFFGFKRPRKEMGAPVLLLAASDILLNRMNGYPVTVDTFATVLYYAAAVLLGGMLKDTQTEGAGYFGRVAGLSLAGSITFYVISNFVVWAAWTLYPHTLSGLGACYVAAIPFFQKTLASDMVYSLAIFSTPLVVRSSAGSRVHEA